MKKVLAFVLVVTALLALSIYAFAAGTTELTASASVTDLTAEEADEQITFLYDNKSTWTQKTQSGTWYYAVTDLDHNGKLEIIAASLKGSDNDTSAVIYEADVANNKLTKCSLSSKNFPDILKENADTYFDSQTNEYYYLFSNGTSIGTDKYYTSICSITLKDGVLTDTVYATQTCELENGYNVITCTDANGQIITPDVYASAGATAFAGLQQSSTNFGWFQSADATTVSALTDSYSIFNGTKPVNEAGVSDLTPKSSSTPAPAATAVPYVPTQNVNYLYVTKNPTNETREEGSTAWFVANAENYNSIVWTFVSPYGYECSYQNFVNTFPGAYIYGINSTQLSISNLSLDMSGWGAYCTFYNGTQTARSNTAYMYVYQKVTPTPAPTSAPTGGSMSGSVTDFLMSTVTIYLDNGTSVQVMKDICNVSVGDLAVGAPCTVYYSGSAPTQSTVYWVDIQGLVYSAGNVETDGQIVITDAGNGPDD